MLRPLDELFRELFLAPRIPALTATDQVRFQPPDATLRAEVVNLNDLALDVYLVELRENRKLRTNERTPVFEDGFVSAEPAPALVDCHYLVSAWSPAQPALEPALDEHALLYEAAAVLFQNAPLNPSRVYPPGSPALAAWPERFRRSDLPTALLPPEGFAKLSEFWTTMGQDARWKPVLHLVVTLPVVLLREMAGFMVTTRITDYRIAEVPETTEVWMQIGGHVLDAANPLPGGDPRPVPDAWVHIETLAGRMLRRTRTNALGRFAFGRLRADRYRLHTVAVGLGTLDREVDVPAETAEYNLLLP